MDSRVFTGQGWVEGCQVRRHQCMETGLWDPHLVSKRNEKIKIKDSCTHVPTCVCMHVRMHVYYTFYAYVNLVLSSNCTSVLVYIIPSKYIVQ